MPRNFLDVLLNLLAMNLTSAHHVKTRKGTFEKRKKKEKKRRRKKKRRREKQAK